MRTPARLGLRRGVLLGYRRARYDLRRWRGEPRLRSRGRAHPGQPRYLSEFDAAQGFVILAGSSGASPKGMAMARPTSTRALDATAFVSFAPDLSEVAKLSRGRREGSHRPRRHGFRVEQNAGAECVCRRSPELGRRLDKTFSGNGLRTCARPLSFTNRRIRYPFRKRKPATRTTAAVPVAKVLGRERVRLSV